jgi:hypothetical protein
MLTTDTSNNGTILGHGIVKQDRKAHLEDIRRYVHHGVLWEEDGWVREEEEWTMRRKEEEDNAKLRGGLRRQWGSPMLGIIKRNLLL